MSNEPITLPNTSSVTMIEWGAISIPRGRSSHNKHAITFRLPCGYETPCAYKAIITMCRIYEFYNIDHVKPQPTHEQVSEYIHSLPR